MKGFLKREHAGFTLLEMLMYIALLVVLAVATIASLVALGPSYQKLRAAHTISRSADAALERMVREARSAEAVLPGSVFGMNPGRLVLSAGPTTTEFYVANGRLYVSENNVPIGALTDARVVVSNLVFRHVVGTHSEGIRIELSLSSSTSTRAVASTTAQFYSFAVMRGSYQ